VGVHLISVPKVTVGFGCFHRAGAGNARIYKGFEVTPVQISGGNVEPPRVS
jgi:hypothetical protein